MNVIWRPSVEKRRLAQPGGNCVVVELGGLLEGLRARPESDRGPRLLDRLTFFGSGLGLPFVELLVIDVPPAPDLGFEPAGERVDHGDPDAVQPAGHRVAALLELAAGVKGVRTVSAPTAWSSTSAHGDATPVVDDLDSPIGEEGHLDRGGVAGHRLVDRVVHDLPDEVMQAAGPVDPMYIPGRRLTASRPSSTVMSLAS